MFKDGSKQGLNYERVHKLACLALSFEEFFDPPVRVGLFLILDIYYDVALISPYQSIFDQDC
jgi:hypothetical protein